MSETPKQAARRIVHGVLADWAGSHPDPEVRAWAQRQLDAELVAALERMTDGFRGVGAAFRRMAELVKAATQGLAEGLAAGDEKS